MPPVIEFVYYSLIFVQPLAFKDSWHARVQIYVDKFDSFYGLASLGVYLWLTLRLVNEYRVWTANNQSQGDPETIRFINGILLAFGVTWLLAAGFQLFDSVVRSSSYSDRFPYYIWIALLVYGLGSGALRFTDRIPRRGPVDSPAEVKKNTVGPAWPEIAASLEQRCVEQNVWVDSQLSLDSLAAKLEVSPTHLSKALNVGFGESFSAFVNRHRVELVAACLRDEHDDREILEIAFEFGFNSKASFNRCFRQILSDTPSEYRRKNRPA
ncbi:MAG: helix-turn-helix domain-containing protein [Fimbriimonas sp.]